MILVKGEDTGGRYSLMYEALPKGSGAPPHKHIWSDEHFSILDGDSPSWSARSFVRAARATSFSYRETPRHAFRVDSETATFLNGYAPAGLELAVAECAMPAPTRTIPPKGATPPPKMTEDQ